MTAQLPHVCPAGFRVEAGSLFASCKLELRLLSGPGASADDAKVCRSGSACVKKTQYAKASSVTIRVAIMLAAASALPSRRAEVLYVPVPGGVPVAAAARDSLFVANSGHRLFGAR